MPRAQRQPARRAAKRSPGRPAGPSPGGGPRERLLSAASELFATKGIAAVGLDELLKRAGVARMSLYQHFEGKEELVAEYLRRKHAEFSAWIERETAHAPTPRERILAVFDALLTWHRQDDFHGCSFARALGEIGSSSAPIRAAIDEHNAAMHQWLRALCEHAAVRDPAEAAASLAIIINGANLCAAAGDRTDASRRARSMAQRLLER
ncbi:MAG: TetR/AcrR family transcriptional regulator [Phycisphaerales bacterium]